MNMSVGNIGVSRICAYFVVPFVISTALPKQRSHKIENNLKDGENSSTESYYLFNRYVCVYFRFRVSGGFIFG